MNLDPTSLPIEPLTLGSGPVGPSKAAQETVEQEKLKKTARDFESIFVHQMLSVMKDTVPDDDQEDASTEQIQGMYWSFMAQAVSDEGGIGMWKDLYSMMSGPRKTGSIEPEADDKPGLDERI